MDDERARARDDDGTIDDDDDDGDGDDEDEDDGRADAGEEGARDERFGSCDRWCVGRGCVVGRIVVAGR